MRVARVEIFGFKSFMERLVLPLDAGITGVVGPNGCGKSNIVDAIRWVLGETRASSLRGELLEDVIFNGTENLRPLGLAEVTVTLRSSGSDFFADLVSPTVEAENASQSILDELSVSSAEVASLNKEAEASHSPEEEEEQSQEEVEGSGERPKLKVIRGQLGKKADGEQEGAPTEKTTKPVTGPSLTFLSRFSWLKSANEVQVTRRLYRSGESEFFINRVSCRLKDIKDLFRAVGLSARAYTVVAQGEVSRVVTSKPEERRVILEDAAGVAGFRDKIAAANRRLDDTAINVSRLDDLIGEVSRQVGVLKKQAARARDRQSLKNEIASLDKLLFADSFLHLSARHKEIHEALESQRREGEVCESNLARVQALEHEARSMLLSVDVETDEIRSRIDAMREELGNRARIRSARESRVQELKALTVSASNERTRLEDRLGVLLKRRGEIETDCAALEAEESSLGVKLEHFNKLESEHASKSLVSEIEEERSILQEKEALLRERRDQVVSHRSAIEQIKRQLQEFASSEELQHMLEGDEQQKLKLLGDCLEVEPRYARAAQAALGRHSEFFVCDDPHGTADRAIKRRPEQQQTPFGLIARESAAAVARTAGAAGKPLIECLKIKEGYEGIFQRLFANIRVVENSDEALRNFKSSPDSPAVFVSLDGDLISRDSFQTDSGESGLVRLNARLEELESECSRAQDSHDHLEEECAVTREILRGLERKQAEMFEHSQKFQRELSEISSARGAVRGRIDSEKRFLQQVEADVSRVKSEISDAAARLESYRSEEFSVLDELKALVPESEINLKDELESLKGEHQKLDATRREGHEKLSTFALDLDKSRKTLDQARAGLSNLTLEAQKVALERQSLNERVVNEYGSEMLDQCMTLSESVSELDADTRASHQQESSRLKSRLLREGEVDPTSIERYDEENARLEHLTAQRDDLQQAADTLKRTVELLTATSEQRFRTTFEAVRENFSQLIPRLFGGGKADLMLTDPNNPLDSGVEIMVRPPGKKLRSIELLSGGEKALCATSLIFAMFMVRPSPLCVLDEVDAPLDDANLVRLLSLIREMSTHTQFVMITHNKQSMSVADNLIGVTMQQPGASRVISVSLQDAFSQVA